jgi:phosphatidylinositol alpha-1,6-mannosyltransferase
MGHLLVTNDFPPKIGGIQSYLHELWRRLPPEDTTVFTTGHKGAADWDAQQGFRIVRAHAPFLGPTPRLVRRINELAEEVRADLVLLDPAWPLGAIGPELERPFGLILHGAEVAVPARLPAVQLSLRRSLRAASVVIASGRYAGAQGRFSAGRAIDPFIIPPGVDAVRFRPLPPDQRYAARLDAGVEGDEVVVLGVSRLVRRKGFDVLIEAAAQLAEDDPDLDFVVLIAGDGRDRDRLDKLAEHTGAPVRFLGRVPDDELPALYGAADVFAMLCRDQWGGLEQEGFGIVFLEAAAAGLPALAGTSGGSAEAVADSETGIVVEDPRSVDDVREQLERLVRDRDQRRRLGAAARERAVRSFSYDTLALDLRDTIESTIAEIRRIEEAAAFESERLAAVDAARTAAAAADQAAGIGPYPPATRPGGATAPVLSTTSAATAGAAARPEAVRPIRAPGGPAQPRQGPGAGTAPPLDLREPAPPLDLTGPDPGLSGGPGPGPLPRRPGVARRSGG